jgi:uncharacterized protein (DUF736 family)
MAFEQRDLSGVLFKNDRKTKETHPDYKGSMTLEGVGYWLAAWVKTKQSGEKFMSIAVEPKDASPRQQAPTGPSMQEQAAATFGDSAPF